MFTNGSAVFFTHVGKGAQETVLRLNGEVFFRFLLRDFPADLQNLLPVVLTGQRPFAPVPQIVQRGFRNDGMLRGFCNVGRRFVTDFGRSFLTGSGVCFLPDSQRVFQRHFVQRQLPGVSPGDISFRSFLRRFPRLVIDDFQVSVFPLRYGVDNPGDRIGIPVILQQGQPESVFRKPLLPGKGLL